MELNANGRIKILVDALYAGHQDRFAAAVQVNKGTVSRWITGTNGIARNTLVKIAQQLQGRVNEAWLVNGEGDSGLPNRRMDRLLTFQELSGLNPTYAHEDQADYKPGPSMKKAHGKSFKEKIAQFFDRKMQEIEVQMTAHKEMLRQMKEETLSELDEYLEMAD